MVGIGDRSFTSITFLWIGLFGWREWLKLTPITLKSITNLPKEFDTAHLYKRFSHYWNTELYRSTSGKLPRLWLALYLTFRFTFLFLALIGFLYLALVCSSYFILIWLIRALEDDGIYTTWHLIGIASLLCFCGAAYSFLGHTLEYSFSVIGMKYRNLLTTAIFHKLQTMSLSQVQNISIGNVLTIINSDLFKFDEYFNIIIFIILSPIGILVMVGLAVLEIGWTATLIIPLFLLHLFIQLCLGNLLSAVYKRALNWSDKRNKHLKEFFEGIRLIKCFAWEYAVAESIRKIKGHELSLILQNHFIKVLTSSLADSFPLLFILMICLSIFVSIGGEFTSSRVFGFAAYMFLYSYLYNQFNYGITGISELRICNNRVQIILEAPGRIYPTSLSGHRLAYRIKVSGLTAGKVTANLNPHSFINDISFEMNNGDTVSVIGRVGSGKSSLLLSLVNELDIIRGGFEVNGSCAYVPQEPWIVSTSIRDNITYGRPWDEAWYDRVVSSCCLELDLSQLPDGDQTVVGDRGITLSGGQKARISLARAVYADMDVYLLDDPLSSVDAGVASKLFSIFTTGILSGRTTILVTHQLQFVRGMDRILLLEDGKLVTCGSYSAIMDHPEFNQFSQFESSVPIQTTLTPYHDYSENSDECNQALSAVSETSNHTEFFPAKLSHQDPIHCNDDNIKEDITRLDKISWLVYVKYFWSGGNIWGMSSLLFLSLTAFFGLIVGRNYYLVWWIVANAFQSNVTNSTTYSMLSIPSRNVSGLNPLVSLSFETRIYFFFGLCIIVSLLLIASSVTYSWIPAFASHKLHNRMLWSVLRAPSSFFFNNSIGSIMNRFAKDISTMDHLLPRFYYFCFQILFYMLFTFVAALMAHWLTLVPCILLVAILFIYRFQLVRTIRQLKRIESAAKSDVISHFSSTLHGLTTIHSLNLESHQIVKMFAYQNTHLKCWRTFYAYIRFFVFQVDVLVSVYGFLVAVILIFLREDLSSIVSAFILSQVFSLLDRAQSTLRISAEVEMNMVSVERVLDYIDLPQEPPLHSSRASQFHVTRGDVEFRDVELRYSSELPLVLKGVSFQVRGGEKVGIVGRTGSGKTSLQNALLRLIELSSGSICIDGVDVRELGLHELRNQISIIPQDPVLFSGSLRFALDPFSSFRDDQVWQVLEEVELGEKVRKLEGQLEFSVSEGGSNFSVGERQLLCLARAILKQSRILMLDEATSYVDTITDSKIQRLFQSKFGKCTVFTIAHRIHTVMQHDRILVMKNGEIVESGSPIKLLEDPTTLFSSFADAY